MVNIYVGNAYQQNPFYYNVVKQVHSWSLKKWNRSYVQARPGSLQRCPCMCIQTIKSIKRTTVKKKKKWRLVINTTMIEVSRRKHSPRLLYHPKHLYLFNIQYVNRMGARIKERRMNPKQKCSISCYLFLRFKWKYLESILLFILKKLNCIFSRLNMLLIFHCHIVYLKRNFPNIKVTFKK